MGDAKANSSFLDIISRRRSAPPPPSAVDLPNEDDDQPDDGEGTELGFGAAEGQSFMIEYRDSRGNLSRRRITVWSVIAGSGGVPCLMARCHERKAERNFRVDRIQCCIDYDGEVYDDVETFLDDTLGLGQAISAYNQTNETEDVEARWKDILGICRHYALLLAALSECDGTRRPEEREVALEFCRNLCAKRGIDLSLNEEAALKRYYKNLHPSGDTIVRSVDRILGEQPEDIVALLVAGKRLIEADGNLDQNEVELLDRLSEDLVGMPLS